MEDLSNLVSQLRINANIPPPVQFNNYVDGLANIYTFEVKPPTGGVRTVVYRYDVELVQLSRNKSLTTGASDDGKKALLQDICFEIVNATFRGTNGFGGGNGTQFVYDNRKNLFTNVRVQPMVREIPPEALNDFCRKFLRSSAIRFELKECKTASFELDLNDLKPSLSEAPHLQSDRSLRTFLEMLTSQQFINDGNYKVIGAGRLFERKEHIRLNPAITTHKGLAKGVRIITNGDRKPTAALVGDVKTCAFFASDNLEKIANEMIQRSGGPRGPPQKVPDDFWQEFGQLYKGVTAYLTYAPSRIISIDSITARKCSEIKIEVDGKEMTIVEFFRIKKNTEINGNFPAVRQQTERDSLFPLSCLVILPYQRFPLDKISINYETQQISSRLLKENAVAPDVRYAAINERIRSIGLPEGASGKFMVKFGVKLKGGRNDAQIGMRQLPKMRFDGQEVAQRDNQFRFGPRGNWRYLEPSRQLKSWIVAHTRRLNVEDVRRFIGNLMGTAQRRGMALPPPTYETIEMDALERSMEMMRKSNIEFLFYIDNKVVKSHFKLKLFEIKYGIVTQHVTFEMASKAGPASIENVLNKMNMKLSGLNYLPVPDPVAQKKFNLTSGNVLVIGLDTSKPPKATPYEKIQMRKQGMEGLESEDPLVIGVCANYLKNPEKFCGDYFYQPCKQDVLENDFIIKKIKWVLEQVKVNRGKPPQIIFVIRDGISEGMVPDAIRGEFTAVKEACKQFAAQWAPKFVFCVVDKKHNKRFFAKGQQPGQAANTMPGATIDRKFVRVDLHEFYMQSHYPLKGCSKIPQYMIPINDADANNDEIQGFLMSLCNMWQIVALAPALPSPVLQAKELAKRGRNNFTEFKRSTPQAIPRVVVDGQPGRMIDFDRLNNMLSYAARNPKLLVTRFNA